MVLEIKKEIIGKRKGGVNKSGRLKEDRLEDHIGDRKHFIGKEGIGKGLKTEERNGRLKEYSQTGQ